MSDNKKYYYLKLKDNFFDSEEIIILQNMQDGYLYSDILFKMYLRSLKNEGLLMFNNLIPYDANILSQIVRHSVGVVEKAIRIFKQLGLIDIMDNGAIYMLHIQNYIGQSSTEADRQRAYQERIKTSREVVIIPCKESNMKTTPELEIELERKKEKELKLKKEQQESFNIFWDLYNLKVNKSKSFKEWIKIKEELHQSIYNHVRDYRQTKKGKEFPYNPNNYLKDEHWNDELINGKTPELSEEEYAESLRLKSIENERFFK